MTEVSNFNKIIILNLYMAKDIWFFAVKARVSEGQTGLYMSFGLKKKKTEIKKKRVR